MASRDLPTPYDPGDEMDDTNAPEVSERSRSVALVLGVLGGWAGLHRFYTGRTESGIYMAITLGGLGVWWLYDMVVLVAGEFKDVEGLPVRAWDPQQAPAAGASQEILRLDSEVARLNQQMAELAERVDFTERMLAQERERRQLKS
jgi:TM2 domain-containing membrane protein YozV